MANSTKAERQALMDAKGLEPRFDGKTYYTTAPSKRQAMSVEDKVKDLGYQPGIFAKEVLDARGGRVIVKNREGSRPHSKNRQGK